MKIKKGTTDRKRKEESKLNPTSRHLNTITQTGPVFVYLSGGAVQGRLDRAELRADELLLTQLLFSLLQVLTRLLQPEINTGGSLTQYINSSTSGS